MISMEEALYVALRDIMTQVIALGPEIVGPREDLINAINLAMDVLAKIGGVTPIDHLPKPSALKQEMT